MKRLFVAIELPDEIGELAAAIKAMLETELRGARWVAPANIHMTLNFLGDSQESQIAGIESALKAALATVGRFAGVTKDIGAFPSARRAQVLWLGVEEKPDFQALYTAVEVALRPLGFIAQRRDFRPHITLARLNRPNHVAIDKVGSKINLRRSFGVDFATLYASYLSPTGPEHKVLARIKLDGNA